VNIKLCTDILRRFRDAVRRKRLEKWRIKSWGSPLRQCSGTPARYGQGFLSKEQRENTEASPILSCSGSNWFFPQLKSALKGRRFCDATDVIKNATKELKKAFIKRHPGMFPKLLKSLAEVYSYTRKIWRKWSLNDCTLSHFSERKWFWEHYEAIMYVKVNLSWRTNLATSDFFKQWQSSGTMEMYNNGRF